MAKLSADQGNFRIKNKTYITPSLVKEACSTFAPNKAAGPDGISPKVLQNLPDKAYTILSEIYSAAHTIGYSPEIWRKSKVVLIPKIGKSDYSSPKSFRPISLTSFCLKALERLTHWHLQQTTLKKFPISNKQHAFVKGSSTETALSEAVSYIEKNIYKPGGHVL